VWQMAVLISERFFSLQYPGFLILFLCINQTNFALI
jgi:hypothetical protein